MLAPCQEAYAISPWCFSLPCDQAKSACLLRDKCCDLAKHCVPTPSPTTTTVAAPTPPPTTSTTTATATTTSGPPVAATTTAAVPRFQNDASWVAGSFGDCVLIGASTGNGSRPLGEAFQRRTVQCQSAVDSSFIESSRCAGLPKPRLWSRCDCGLVLCKASSGEDHGVEERHAEGLPSSGSRDRRYSLLGCLPDLPEDYRSLPGNGIHDYTCLDWQQPEPCRNGLPFYRLSGEIYPDQDMCFDFCLSKGLDIFGLVRAGCLCGASAINRQAWHWLQPRAGFGFPWELLEDENFPDDSCGIRTYRYTGHFEDGGAVPFDLLHLSLEDEAYLDEMAIGHKFDPIAEEHEPDHLEKLPLGSLSTHGADSLTLLSSGKNSCVDCPCTGDTAADGYGCWVDPYGNGCGCYMINGHSTQENCDSFGGTYCPVWVLSTTSTTPWPSWQRPAEDSQAGTRWPNRVPGPGDLQADVWQEYVEIPYRFDSMIDDTRKVNLQKAVAMWRDTTCIKFVEVDLSYNAAESVLITIWNENSCSANLGYGGTPGVNLGWCKDAAHVGSMAHELAHILGVNHEQKRPDAASNYFGKGPHLIMYWQNVPTDWVSQYTADSKTYTGSDDVYANYDFESIMHYGGGNRFDTIPASMEQVVGGRSELSAGDINHIRDVYECMPKTSTTTTIPSELIPWARCNMINDKHPIPWWYLQRLPCLGLET